MNLIFTALAIVGGSCALLFSVGGIVRAFDAFKSERTPAGQSPYMFLIEACVRHGVPTPKIGDRNYSVTQMIVDLVKKLEAGK